MKFEIKDPLFLPHCGCDVHFTLKPFEALVIQGENGIGKSTFLEFLTRSLGRELWCLVDQKALDYFYDRRIGQIKDIFLDSPLVGLDKNSLLELWRNLGLSEKSQRRVSELSGGEGQALKLCLNLCKEAPYYFLDEPTHFLDAERKSFLLSYLEELRRKGKGILMVEHDLLGLPRGWRVLPLHLKDQLLTQGDEWII